jgi:hypothetical protein
MSDKTLDESSILCCVICGNNKCSSCRKLLDKGFIHVYWYEDICTACQGPPLTDEEVYLNPKVVKND